MTTKAIIIKEYIGEKVYFTIYNKLTWDTIKYTNTKREALQYAEKNNLRIITNN